jgi:hypothetical protein
VKRTRFRSSGILNVLVKAEIMEGQPLANCARTTSLTGSQTARTVIST